MCDEQAIRENRSLEVGQSSGRSGLYVVGWSSGIGRLYVVGWSSGIGGLYVVGWSSGIGGLYVVGWSNGISDYSWRDTTEGWVITVVGCGRSVALFRSEDDNQRQKKTRGRDAPGHMRSMPFGAGISGFSISLLIGLGECLRWFKSVSSTGTGLIIKKQVQTARLLPPMIFSRTAIIAITSRI